MVDQPKRKIRARVSMGVLVGIRVCGGFCRERLNSRYSVLPRATLVGANEFLFDRSSPAFDDAEKLVIVGIYPYAR